MTSPMYSPDSPRDPVSVSRSPIRASSSSTSPSRSTSKSTSSPRTSGTTDDSASKSVVSTPSIVRIWSPRSIPAVSAALNGITSATAHSSSTGSPTLLRKNAARIVAMMKWLAGPAATVRKRLCQAPLR